MPKNRFNPYECSVCDIPEYPEDRAGEHNASPEHRKWLLLGGKRNLTPEVLKLIEEKAK